MVDCITAIELWCRLYGLKLNVDKSDVMWLGTRQLVSKIIQADKDLHLTSGILRASETTHNLGVIIHQQLTFDAHARACSTACFYQLHRIRQIRQFLDKVITHPAGSLALDKKSSTAEISVLTIMLSRRRRRH